MRATSLYATAGKYWHTEKKYFSQQPATVPPPSFAIAERMSFMVLLSSVGKHSSIML